jgi:hypothetical protein
MNHPLSVYTVIYLAILFVAVSIWGSSLGAVSGDGRLLLVALGAFSLKVAIDDYIHFQGVCKNLHADLWLSLLIYLLMAATIAATATQHGSVAVGLFAGVFGVGVIWILKTGMTGPGAERRKGWLVVNAIAVVLLLLAMSIGPDLKKHTFASIPLALLASLVGFDFVHFGSLRRLAKLGAGQGDGAGRVSTGGAPAAPGAAPPAAGASGEAGSSRPS